MKVYCAHAIKRFHKASNFYQCLQCPAGWYAQDRIPLVIIGYTEQIEVRPDRVEKDMTKKRFKRCDWCHDTIEKRSHWNCKFWKWADQFTVGPAPEKPTRGGRSNG